MRKNSPRDRKLLISNIFTYFAQELSRSPPYVRALSFWDHGPSVAKHGPPMAQANLAEGWNDHWVGPVSLASHDEHSLPLSLPFPSATGKSSKVDRKPACDA